MAKTKPAPYQARSPVRVSGDDNSEEKRPTSPFTEEQHCPISEDEYGVVILTTAQLEPLKDPSRTHVTFAVQGLKDDDWLQQHEELMFLRQTIVHHHALLTGEQIEAILPALACVCDSLRSALSKNALFALGECFEFLCHACLSHLGLSDRQRPSTIIDVVLRRAACEKRFLRDAALLAVDKLIHHLASRELIAAVSSYATNKNAKIVAIASRVLAQSLSRLNSSPNWDAEQFATGRDNCSVYEALARFREGKESAARSESLGCLRLLGLSLGRERFEAVLTITLGSHRQSVGSIVADVFPPLGMTKTLNRRGSLKDRVLLKLKNERDSVVSLASTTS